MLVVLHGDGRHLGLGRPVLLHVGTRDEREDAGEGEAERLLPDGVGGVREVLGGLGGRHVEHALAAADQDDVGDAGRNLHDRVTERGVGRGARGLEARRGDRGDPEDGRGLGSGVELVLGLAADDVAVVEGLDPARGDLRVGQRVRGGFREEL